MAPAARAAAAAAIRRSARPALPPDRGVRRAVRIAEENGGRSESSPTRSRTPVGKRTATKADAVFNLLILQTMKARLERSTFGRHHRCPCRLTFERSGRLSSIVHACPCTYIGPLLDTNLTSKI